MVFALVDLLGKDGPSLREASPQLLRMRMAQHVFNFDCNHVTEV